ncbi:MAG TPA: zf-HC2 domain-containing protein [Pyrinomonadaceae bacterium]|nr:zf-HC2 domain-containing protein [Pyrinomonadaceae bacterium]
MKCHDFREKADSYLSDELLVETNHDVITHLESCADCRRELAARRELRGKLRQGFHRAPELQISEEFANRLNAQLRESALRRPRPSFVTRASYIAVAAALIIVAALGFRAVQQRWRSQNSQVIGGGVNPKDAPNLEHKDGGSALLLSAELAESMVGDHRNCALSHRLDEKPINLDEAGRKFDRAYIKLVNAVMAEGILPADVQLVKGHSCVFKGQRFGHIILKYDGKVVSVLVTSVEAQGGRALTGMQETIASMQVSGFQLAYFKTKQHAVSVVSSLGAKENLLIARALEPSLTRHIREAEGST